MSEIDEIVVSILSLDNSITSKAGFVCRCEENYSAFSSKNFVAIIRCGILRFYSFFEIYFKVQRMRIKYLFQLRRSFFYLVIICFTIRLNREQFRPTRQQRQKFWNAPLQNVTSRQYSIQLQAKSYYATLKIQLNSTAQATNLSCIPYYSISFTFRVHIILAAFTF